MALESGETQTAVYDGKAIYAFKLGDSYYRAIASISPEDEQAYMDIDFMDDDYEEQQKKLREWHTAVACTRGWDR